MNIYPLHLLANESDDIWNACICSMIYINCGVQMDLLNKERQTAVQISALKNGALFSVFMNMKVDLKMSIYIYLYFMLYFCLFNLFIIVFNLEQQQHQYSPSTSPIPPLQPNLQQQQGFQFRGQKPSFGVPRTASIGSRGDKTSPRTVENDGTPATLYELEMLRKEMKDMQSEFGSTLLLFGKINGVYGEPIDLDGTLGSV